MFSNASAQPLLVNYKGGIYQFTLEVDGPVAFCFPPSTPLSTVVTSIKEESEGQIASAAFVNEAGAPLPDTFTLGDVLKSKNGCRMQLGHTQKPVVMTRSMSYGDPEVEGHTELPSLLEKARILELRAKLELVTRRSIPLSEFVDTCKACGISQEDSYRVAADLHKVGVLLYFAKEPELAGTVYLRPEEVLEDFFSRYGMDSPLRQHLQRRIAELEAQAVATQDVIGPMHALRDSLNDRARAYASRLMWGVSLGVAGGAGVYWYLAYIHFSWDIMEPVTFFTGLGVTTVGYAWWMVTNREYEYANIYDYFLQKNKLDRYKKGGLDYQKLEAFEAKLVQIREEISDVDARCFQLEVMGVKKPVTTATATLDATAESITAQRKDHPGVTDAADAASSKQLKDIAETSVSTKVPQ